MPTSPDVPLADRFLALHQGPGPLLIPNPWDAGSAKLLASLGFTALATTSSGAAMAQGLADGELGIRATFENAAAIVAATPLPVSADMENGFAANPAEVADTVRRCLDIGLSGCSIEDFTGRGDEIYDLAQAVDRVKAAASAAHDGPVRLVLTARAENHIHGHDDLADTIARLRAYADVGADVLYAPGLTAARDIRRVVESVHRPVNVLALPASPPVAELAAIGVRRISVGGAFAFAAFGALAEAATELRERGTYDFLTAAAAGKAAAQRAIAWPAYPPRL